LRPGAARFIVARQDPVPFDLLIEVVLCEAVETSPANLASPFALPIEEGSRFDVVQGQNCILRAKFVDEVVVGATWANAFEPQSWMRLSGREVCNTSVSNPVVEAVRELYSGLNAYLSRAIHSES
jgi:hypothetical protein